MTIDLNKDERLGYTETSFELSKLKSNKLIKEIVMQRNKTGQNFMIVPMSIYNILEANDSFKFARLESLMSEELLRHMGSIHGIEVYLDLFSPSCLPQDLHFFLPVFLLVLQVLQSTHPLDLPEPPKRASVSRILF